MVHVKESGVLQGCRLPAERTALGVHRTNVIGVVQSPRLDQGLSSSCGEKG